jgi:flavin prenyltransferase
MFQICRRDKKALIWGNTTFLLLRSAPRNAPRTALFRREVFSRSLHNVAPQKRIVVGITGATGAVYAIRVLSILRDLGIETHLVMSKWAAATLKYETTTPVSEIYRLASKVYSFKDMAAPIASGSFLHDGMIIVPCSMRTLASVRIGICDDLISRAADVSLKEGRKLMLVVRETPLSDIHLSNMLFLRQAGAIVFPPVPAFYNKPLSLEDMIDQSAGRILDCMGIHTDGFRRWNGFEKAAEDEPDGRNIALSGAGNATAS